MSDDASRIKQGETFLDLMRSTRKKAQIFPPNHNYVRESVENMLGIVNELFDGQHACTFSVAANELYMDGKLLAEASLELGDLIDEMDERKLFSWTIRRGVTPEELTAFVALTNEKPSELERRGGWDRVIEEQQIAHIQANQRFAMGGAKADPPRRAAAADGVKVSREVYARAMEAAVSAFTDSHARQLLNMEMMDGVVGLLVSTISLQKDIIASVHEIKSADEYTLSHSVNVAILSLLLGTKLNLSGVMLHRLGLAALLHDIGKTAVPEEILNKPEQLTPEEWAIMEAHTLEGVKILSEQNTVDHLGLVIAAQHHARIDLKGYPDFHALKDIHTLSKLVAVVDAYDAITSNRSYRRAMLPDRAMKVLLQGVGTQFDPVMLKLFVQMTGMYPVGSFVQLDTGEFGVVTQANPSELYRPVVKVVIKEGVDLAEFRIVDLAQTNEDGEYERNIVQSVDPKELGVEAAQYL